MHRNLVFYLNLLIRIFPRIHFVTFITEPYIQNSKNHMYVCMYVSYFVAIFLWSAIEKFLESKKNEMNDYRQESSACSRFGSFFFFYLLFWEGEYSYFSYLNGPTVFFQEKLCGNKNFHFPSILLYPLQFR